ncbi:MAG: hypothetical protein JXJ17_00945 [Anaerolineae bacterium]|nr:hypothetical protein [Anaerolineae bacterium]
MTGTDQPQPTGDQVGGDKITVGDIAGSVAAIGAGAQVIYHNVERALTGVEIAEQSERAERQRLADAVTGYVGRLEQMAEKSAEGPISGSPYKSLLSYDFDDAALFYGRSKAIDDLLERLERGPLTVLHADSGAGKTSLLKAGIMPRLMASGDVPLYVRPYQLPAQYAIKRVLLPQMEQSPFLAVASLRDFFCRVTDLLGGKRLVAILDQFEEVFTVQSKQMRADFISEMAPCLDDNTLPVRWIFALRNEWFGQMGTFRPDLRDPYANEFLLRALSREEASEIIIEPARRFGVEYEPGLVDTLVADLGEHDIAPPQLQLVCSTLFDGLGGGQTQIAQAQYDALGQTSGILRSHLDRVLTRNVPPEQRYAARRLLEALMTSDRRRARCSKDDLAAELQVLGIEQATLEEVLGILVDSRLLSVEEVEIEETNEVRVAYELAHDYLLDEIELDPEVQARKAAQELLAKKLPYYTRDGLLLSKGELAIISPHRDELALDTDAESLLDSSTRRERRRLVVLIASIAVGVLALVIGSLGIAINRARGEAIVEEQLRIAQTAQVVAEESQATAVASEADANDARVEAESARDDAEQSQGEAEAALSELTQAQSREYARIAQGLLANHDYVRATELAVQAYRLAPTSEAEGALANTLGVPFPLAVTGTGGRPVSAAARSQDGRWLIAGTEFGEVLIWDTQAPDAEPMILSGHEGPVQWVDTLAGGTRIVSLDDEQGLKLWDIETGEALGSDILGWGSPLLISDDRTRFVSVEIIFGERINFMLRDAADGTVINTLQDISEYVSWAELNPTGELIAIITADDNTMRVWNLETGELVFGRVGDAEFTIEKCGFSPDSSRLYVSNDSDLTLLLDAETGDKITDITGVPVSPLADFSPDGGTLITSRRFNNQNPVYLWDAETGQLETILEGHEEAVTMFDYSDDNYWLMTSGDDGTVRVWDTRGGDQWVMLDGLGEQVFWASFVDDSHALVVSTDLNIHFYDLGTGLDVATLSGPPIGSYYETPFIGDPGWIITGGAEEELLSWQIEALLDADPVWEPFGEDAGASANDFAYSADGALMVSGGQEVILWDATSGERRWSAYDPGGEVFRVAISPDGSHIATIADNGSLSVLQAEDGLTLYSYIIPDYWFNDIVFGPDGSWLAVSRSDNLIEKFDVESGDVIAVGSTFLNVSVLDVSPDGSLIAYGTADGTAFIQNADLTAIERQLQGHVGAIYSIAFSPDGKTLLTGSTDFTARLWDVETGREIARLSGHTDVVRDAQFSPDGSRIVTASDDHTACVWDASDGTQLYCFPAHSESVSTALFSPDGQHILTLADLLRVWNIDPEVFLSHALDRLSDLGIDVES